MKTLKILHLTDQHIGPFQSMRALKQSLSAISIVKPAILVLGGDLLDCYPISRFIQRKNRLNSLQKELSVSSWYLRACRKRGPHATIIYTQGNHEERLQNYIDTKAPGLATLKALTIPALLPCNELGIKVLPYGKPFVFRGLHFTHGSVIRKWTGRSAQAQSEYENASVAMGHSHRLAAVFSRRGPQVIQSYESGCLCSTRPSYMTHRPDWQQGFSVFTFPLRHSKLHVWAGVDLSFPDALALLKAMNP